jgi:hypothetical protein
VLPYLAKLAHVAEELARGGSIVSPQSGNAIGSSFKEEGEEDA